MHITFIYPNLSKSRSAAAMLPLSFACLAAVTPPDVELTLFDEHVEEIDLDRTTDLVAMSVHTFNARRAYSLAREYRRRGIPVVMGGFHPSLVPDEAGRYTDCVVIGEGEEVWPQIIEDVRSGKLKARYRGTARRELGGVLPDRRLFKDKKYSILQPVQFGRGCRFSCDFCSVHSFFGNSVRYRPIPEVIEEIRQIRGKYLFFVDDNFLGNYKATRELLQAMIPLRKRFICQISLDASNDPQLIALLAHSGCAAVFVGFESLDEDSLVAIGKTANRKSDYMEAVRMFKQHGIMVCGSFVFGYEHDGPDTFERVVAFSIDNKLALSHINILHPTPGTRLYDRLLKSKRLQDERWWLSPGYRYGQAVLNTDRLTARELENCCFAARKKFNSWGSVVRRMWDLRANARTLSNWFLFMASNFVSRAEIYRKQGSSLG